MNYKPPLDIVKLPWFSTEDQDVVKEASDKASIAAAAAAVEDAAAGAGSNNPFDADIEK